MAFEPSQLKATPPGLPQEQMEWLKKKEEVKMEKKIFKGLRLTTGILMVVFTFLSYGGDPVAWAGALATGVASLMLMLIPEEEF